MRFEPLEERQLLAVGPQLIAVDPSQGETLKGGLLLSIAPEGEGDLIWNETLSREIEQAADLDNYSAAELAAADRWVVGFSEGYPLEKTAQGLGADPLGEAPFLSNALVVQFPGAGSWQDVVSTLESAEGVEYFYPLVAHQLQPGSDPDDPLLPDQSQVQDTTQTGAGVQDLIWDQTLTRAIERAADLDNYSAAELAATDRWVVGFSDGYPLEETARDLGGDPLGETPFLCNSLVVQFPGAGNWQDVASTLESAEGVEYFYPLVARQQQAQFVPNDPFFSDQWHLQNTGQTGGSPGADANVVPVWDSLTGAGVVVAVVDDGVQYTHLDLANQYRSDLSYDFNYYDTDPSPDDPLAPFSYDDHGTAVAGVAVAEGNNGLGVSGAAPGAELAALRL
ncbi:MAG: S8 family serine peptidase, partial [Planctomycetota bacterium]